MPLAVATKAQNRMHDQQLDTFAFPYRRLMTRCSWQHGLKSPASQGLYMTACNEFGGHCYVHSCVDTINLFISSQAFALQSCCQSGHAQSAASAPPAHVHHQ
jgi:hypothetical protein